MKPERDWKRTAQGVWLRPFRCGNRDPERPIDVVDLRLATELSRDFPAVRYKFRGYVETGILEDQCRASFFSSCIGSSVTETEALETIGRAF